MALIGGRAPRRTLFARSRFRLSGGGWSSPDVRSVFSAAAGLIDNSTIDRRRHLANTSGQRGSTTSTDRISSRTEPTIVSSNTGTVAIGISSTIVGHHLSFLDPRSGDFQSTSEAALLAFSDHLTRTACRTCYAFGWRRQCRFSRYVPFGIFRPVESTLGPMAWEEAPTQMRFVRLRVLSKQRKSDRTSAGRGSMSVPACQAAPATIVRGTAQDLPLANDSIDLVLTDPPYFDNIDYSEHRVLSPLGSESPPWRALVGQERVAKASLASEHVTATVPIAHHRTRRSAHRDRASAEVSKGVSSSRSDTTCRGVGNALGDALSPGVSSASKFFPILAEGTNELPHPLKEWRLERCSYSARSGWR